MSDNNVCSYCRGASSTGGFLHEWNCPTISPSTNREPVPCPTGCAAMESLFWRDAEIARLKAELEMTEKENALWRGHVQKGSEVIAELYSKLEKAERDIRDQERIITHVIQDCDEARKLAQKYYALWKMVESEILRILKIGHGKEMIGKGLVESVDAVPLEELRRMFLFALDLLSKEDIFNQTPEEIYVYLRSAFLETTCASG